jgi:hypothetical protein
MDLLLIKFYISIVFSITMGCGGSKGKGSTLSLTDIVFKTTGVASLDDFTAACTNILADISGIIAHLFDFKVNFLKSTGFDTVPGSSNYKLSYLLFRNEPRI